MAYKYVFTINEGLNDPNSHESVPVNSYTFADGYFHFLDSDKTKAFSIRADMVSTIQRADAKE